jgi:hypothetical protein
VAESGRSGAVEYLGEIHDLHLAKAQAGSAQVISLPFSSR